MTNLPNGWTWATIGELCDVNPRHFSDMPVDDELVSKVPMAAVEADSGRLDPSELIEYGSVKGKSLTPFQENDVLFAKVTPCMENGKIALARGLYRGRAVGSTELFALRSRGSIEPSYLMRFLLQRSIREKAQRAMTGAVGLRRVPRAFLSSLQIPVPPMAEQRRIVTTLENHISRLEAGLTFTDRAATLIQSLKTTALTNAIVARNEISDWKYLTIGQIADVSTGATPLKSRAEYYNGGTVPWITSALLNRPYIDEAEQFITERALTETSVKLFPPGTLLLAMYGEGRTRGLCSELRISATTNQACAAIRLHSEYLPLRLWVKLVLDASYQRTRDLAAGGVQPNLNLGLVRGIRIPLPPRDVQSRVLDDIEYLRSASASLSATVNGLRLQARELREQLFRACFNGQLVSKNPDEEARGILDKRREHENAPHTQDEFKNVQVPGGEL